MKAFLVAMAALLASSPSWARGVIPYRQAYAICDARALNAADYAPHHCWGLIGCAVRKAERDEHRDAVLRGCLAEYGYY